MPKKRANGEGSIRKRENGQWEARIMLGAKRKSIYGKTQAEVRKKMTALIAEFDSDDYAEPCQMKLREWAEIWQRDYLYSRRPGTIKQYCCYLKNRIIPVLGDIQLAKLRTPSIQHLYTTLIGQVKPKTIRNIHGILHEMLDKAVKLGYLKANPSDACELPKDEHQEMHPILDDDLPRFLQAIADHKYGDLYYVTVFTGMRESEVIGLTWDCIDFDRGSIRLYRQLRKVVGGGGSYEFGPLKSRQERLIEPAPQVIEVLRRVKRKQNEWKLKSGEAWCNNLDLVFTHEDGSQLKVDSIYGCFKRLVKKLGIPATRFHDLRHTFITLSIQNGTDINTVSDTAGHATVAFTMDKYAHVSNVMRKEAAEKMDKLIQSL